MRNADATRERILEAALAEFSAYGIAGGRVDRIAKTAGCNKNLIYIYFESKEKLFMTLLQKHLTRVYEEVPFTPEDLPGYAARVFDFTMTHPDLMRLMTWFSLERKMDDPDERGAAHEAKVAALRQAQEAGQVEAKFPPEFLLTAIMALATAWTTANPIGRMMDADANPSSSLRDYIAGAVRRIAQGEEKSRN